MTNIKLNAIATLELALAHNKEFKKRWLDYIEIIVTEELEAYELKSLNDVRTRISNRVLQLFDETWWIAQYGEKESSELQYITLEEFNIKVVEYAKVNILLRSLLANKFKTWEDLPPHLIQDLFKKLGCKPSMQKY